MTANLSVNPEEHRQMSSPSSLSADSWSCYAAPTGNLSVRRLPWSVRSHRSNSAMNCVESHVANLKIDVEEAEHHPRDFQSVTRTRHSWTIPFMVTWELFWKIIITFFFLSHNTHNTFRNYLCGGRNFSSWQWILVFISFIVRKNARDTR